MVLKKSIFNKIPFYIQRSTEISGIGLHFYQQASSLIGYQTNQRTNPFLSYKTKSHYEFDYKCICIVINGKIRRQCSFKYIKQ